MYTKGKQEFSITFGHNCGLQYRKEDTSIWLSAVLLGFFLSSLMTTRSVNSCSVAWRMTFFMSIVFRRCTSELGIISSSSLRNRTVFCYSTLSDRRVTYLETPVTQPDAQHQTLRHQADWQTNTDADRQTDRLSDPQLHKRDRQTKAGSKKIGRKRKEETK